MSLNDLSDRAAIEKAIAEFDKLGREAFLDKHGFGRARRFFLLTDRGAYDSKAIIGAAHGYQFPDKGPLRSGDFSGGEATVARKLRSLGFDITTEPSGQLWAFCANPKLYTVRDAIAHLDTDSWAIGQSDVKKGDHAVIWQTLDPEGRRGIVGLADVLTDPEVRTDTENPYWLGPKGMEMERRVWVRYLDTSGLPVWVDDPKHGGFLQGLSVARARGGTVFRLSFNEWQRIAQVASYTRPSVEVETAERELRSQPRRAAGQGFGLTSEERRVVEQHAMGLAKRYLAREWESVVDVSAKSSFDFHCRRGSEDLRVEVKGTIGPHYFSFFNAAMAFA